MPRSILFDLDGTITDSGEGIMNCAALALEHFGIPVPSRQALRRFVGPPLDEMFIEFGVPADNAREAIQVYRSRYLTVGKFENFPYPGAEDCLKALRDQGHRLFIATSKPESLAAEILEKFGLAGYFHRICGATFDGTRSTKEQVIAYLLDQAMDVGRPIMVGDTAYDVIGAAAHGIPCIGVSWGYGPVEEMEASGAAAIATSFDQLLDQLNAL